MKQSKIVIYHENQLIISIVTHQFLSFNLSDKFTKLIFDFLIANKIFLSSKMI
jgi:hypothetical protein